MNNREGDPRSFLYVPVERAEQDVLRTPVGTPVRKRTVLSSPHTTGLVRAITTFILSVCIRNWQQSQEQTKKLFYSMIIHNDTKTSAHQWQNSLIEWIFGALMKEANEAPDNLKKLFDVAYKDLSNSVEADGGLVPSRASAFKMWIDALVSDDVVRETVNKDNDVLALLDDNAELRLRTPYNIFIGGNILDRGITIPNLIAFYYGRNPGTMQADTVLQHSRMYGNRNKRDLAVTRFYTSQDVYNRLYTINTFDNALRHALLQGNNEQGVVFMQSDTNGVRPCAPNKVLLSNVVAVEPNGLYLPTGFDVESAPQLRRITERITQLVPPSSIGSKSFTEIRTADAIEIINLIEHTMRFPFGDFEWDAMRGLLNFYTDANNGNEDTVLLLAETGRTLDKSKSGEKSGLSILGAGGDLRSLILDPTRTKPAIVLLQQVGSTAKGWSGTPFWWPILAAPGTVEPCVFATKVSRRYS